MSQSKRLDTPVPALVRELCPVCLGHQGGECARCNGTGYVLVSPYDPRKGEQSWEAP